MISTQMTGYDFSNSYLATVNVYRYNILIHTCHFIMDVQMLKTGLHIGTIGQTMRLRLLICFEMQLWNS